MFAEIGGRTPAELARADPRYAAWVRRERARGTFHAYVAETRDGRPVGSGAVWLAPMQPRPGPLGATARLPYILSMYTEPGFRGRGVGARIVRTMVRWARAEGYARIFLHASPMGRSVYATLGFVAGNEMRLDLRPRRAASRPRAREPPRAGT